MKVMSQLPKVQCFGSVEYNYSHLVIHFKCQAPYLMFLPTIQILCSSNSCIQGKFAKCESFSMLLGTSC